MLSTACPHGAPQADIHALSPRSPASGIFIHGIGQAFAHRLTFERDAMSVVDEPIEDGVGDGGLADDFVPGIYGQLAGDEGGFKPMAVFHHVEQIPALGGAERFQAEVVEDDEIGVRQLLEHAGIAALAVGEGKRAAYRPR